MSRVPSPFKFLDSYQRSDVKVFFGRSKETTELYNALSGVKHIMVYGPSGSGKTSLVECGLRNRFSNADWFALTIRKGSNINASIYTAINEALQNKMPMDFVSKLPEDSSIGFGEAVKKLFKERFQPVYLLFDQFEELLISGDPDEQRTFFEGIDKLIHDAVPCRIMLIMREEFIGHLSEFESLCPNILKNRYRVEKMGRKNVEEVIFQILEAPAYKKFYEVDDSQKLAEKILSRLPDKKKEIELAHVQVFLSELWDRAQSTKPDNELPVLSTALIQKGDNLEKILESFLKKQMEALEGDYGKDVPLELLAAMITEKFTKLQMSAAEIKAELDGKNVVIKIQLADLIQQLVDRRILRILKVEDEMHYEISHDSLARVVGQNLTEEMKIRDKAAEAYSFYEDKPGLFGQGELNLLFAYSKTLPFPIGLKRKVDDSISAIRREKHIEIEKEIADSNKKKKMRILVGALVVLVGFTALIIFLAITAKEQTIIAENKNLEAQKAVKNTKKLLQVVMQGRGDQFENQPDSVIIRRLEVQQNMPIEALIKVRGFVSAENENSENRNYLMWVDVPSYRKNAIKEVRYKLCSGFGDRTRISNEPSSSFSIGYLGRGYCPLGYNIDIILKRGDTIHRILSYDDFVRE